MAFSGPHNAKNVALDSRRRRLAALVVLATLAVGSAVMAPAAGAKTYYKYWGYWHKAPGATSWQYSKVGASGYYLQQGEQVEGWRFAVGTASPSDPQPRPTSASYTSYCNGKNSDKAYRVLLVVDYGTESGAPSGPVYSCYGFDSSVNGFTVLTQQHTERDANGLICAIDSYPKTGCGETVNSPAPKTSTTPRRTTSPTPSATSRTTAAATSASTPVTTVASPSSAATASDASTTTTAAAVSAQAPTNDPTPTDAAQPSARPFTGTSAGSHGTGFPLSLVIGVVVAAAVGIAAWWRLRRTS
jgi:hypothetical protein